MKAKTKALRKFAATVTKLDSEAKDAAAQRIFTLWKRTQEFKAVYEELDQLLARQKFGSLPEVEDEGRVFELEIQNPFAGGKNVVYGHGPVRRKVLKVKEKKVRA